VPFLDFDAIKREITLDMVLAALGWRYVWRQGVQQRGPCPIHHSSNRRSRSFATNANGWFCHKCKVGGDQLSLWAAVRGLSSYDAALDLCQRFNVPAYQMPRFTWHR
jgi:hypothetical protein